MSSNEDTDDYDANSAGPSKSGRREGSNESDAAGVKKRKISRACDVCRRRKVRCDFVQLPSGNLNKCLNCFSSKKECIFSEEQKPRKTTKSYIEALEKKLERTERLLELLCEDPKIRKEMVDADSSDDLPSGLSSPYHLPPAQVTHLPLIDGNEAALRFGTTFRKSALDLAVMSMRAEMYRRYPPEHDENQEHAEDGEVEEDDLPEAEHISRLRYSKMQAKVTDDIALNTTYFMGKSSARTLLGQVRTAKAQTFRNRNISGTSLANVESGAESDANPPEDSVDPGLERGHVNGQLRCDEIHLDAQLGMSRHLHSFLGERRPEFWKLSPWEKETFRKRPIPTEAYTCPYEFPEPGLIKSLVDYYFKYVNIELPLLHRPTFEKELSEGLHIKNPAFGATVLLVCAIGAKYSDDPRVQMSEEDADRAGVLGGFGSPKGPPSHPNSEQRRRRRTVLANHSRGYRYYEQALNARNIRLVFVTATLYDLHYHCLMTEYLRGSSTASWLMVGIGIRLAQDVGAHRKRKLKLHPHLEPDLVRQDELWKRATWVLIALDRHLSASMGRPCGLQDEDFDLDLPIECDDEYWDNPDPELRFKQPDGTPSEVTAFTLTIRLNQILSIILRSIYCIKRSKNPLGYSEERWSSKMVSEIDSALNKWLDTVPPHLHWDPKRANETFFVQSAVLHSAYYHTQILLHRPFIPSPKRPTTLQFPSLTICTNAARSLIHIGLSLLERTGEVSINMPLYATSAAVVLLVSMWDSRLKGTLSEQRYKNGMDDLNSCLEILKSAERRWSSAGKLWDLVYGLATVNELYVPATFHLLKPRNHREDASWKSQNQEAKETSPNLSASSASYASSPFASSPQVQARGAVNSAAESRSPAAVGVSVPHSASSPAAASNSAEAAFSHQVLGKDAFGSKSGSTEPAATRYGLPFTSIDSNPTAAAPAAPAWSLDAWHILASSQRLTFDGDHGRELPGSCNHGAGTDAFRYGSDPPSNPERGAHEAESMFLPGSGHGNPAGDFDMSTTSILPSSWPDGVAPNFDDWGAYLTGVADMTNQHDLLFPQGSSTYPELPRFYGETGAGM